MNLSLSWPMLLAALWGTGLPASAEMYKWRDAEGQVHYSRSPPPGQPAERIKPPPKVDTTKAREALDEKIEKQAIEADERRDREEEAEKAAAQAEAREAACTEARAEAERLAGAARSYRTEADGTRVIQTDEEHKASIAKAESWIEEHCKP